MSAIAAVSLTLEPMNLFVCGLRRSGTTILYDALGEEPGLRCFYEPLREEAADDRRRQRRPRHRRLAPRPGSCASAFEPSTTPSFRSSCSTGVARGRRSWSSSRELPEHCREWLAALLAIGAGCGDQGDPPAPQARRGRAIDPGAAVVHLVRDPRAVTASMLLGRRRRTDIYPDADTFFTARTGRRLWSSRPISEELLERGPRSTIPADIPDFIRPLVVWRAAYETTSGDGKRLFGDRYA